MTITKRSDGQYALDFTANGGTFIVLTAVQYQALIAAINKRR